MFRLRKKLFHYFLYLVLPDRHTLRQKKNTDPDPHLFSRVIEDREAEREK